ncbi:NAD-glutamate dehydrogenase [Magnetovibrio sp.]|uniref:NAD-glutamate dehydrogenase n=1 Tax=Magnetovibrio sp. TaxID=2024836 RepID=UPI002F92492E
MPLDADHGRRTKIVKSILDVALKRVKKSERSLLPQFIGQYFSQVAIDDLAALEPAVLAGLALHHLEAASKHKSGAPIVTIYNPSVKKVGWDLDHTVVEIVTTDKPFLIDSVTAEMNRHGFGVHLSIHPVMRVRRTGAGKLTEVMDTAVLGVDKGVGAESLIHIQIDEQPEIVHDEIRTGLLEVLSDVELAVRDWRTMRATLADLVDELETLTANVPLEEVSEVRDFLRWLHDDNFTFLGYREYEFAGTGTSARVTISKNSSLGVLSDPSRVVFQELRDLAKMPPEVRSFVNRPDLLQVTKTDMRSRVHRPVQMDSIGIKRLDAKGRVIGQRIYVGLFTAGAYNRSARDIPLLRRKIQRTFDYAGLPSNSHNGKTLLNILETFPRDELFQISTEQLLETSLGILRLQDRQKVSLFLRRDDFERFISCLVYVPRDRYSTDLRKKIQTHLEDAFAGLVSAHYAHLGDEALTRLHVVIKTTPGEIPKYDPKVIEAGIAELTRSWGDRLGGALIEQHGEMEGMRLLDAYQNAFNRNYEENFSTEETLDDIKRIELTYIFGRLGLYLYQLAAPSGPPLRFKIYNPKGPVALSDILPMLENMGLRVMEEIPYRARPKEAPYKIVIHDFGLEPRETLMGSGDDVRSRFHAAFDQIWSGAMESDALNALILSAGLDWREVTVLRAYTKYLRQTGITFSETYMARTLVENAAITRGIVDMFMARFQPHSVKEDALKASRKATRLRKKVFTQLDDVSSADEDRILRRYINLVDATLRTNFFQITEDGELKTWLSFKLSSHDIEELPLPRPKFEIFVYSPRVEGVHLRFGNVARGGLRWSDRREDFRTEVLGLVKAQQVKNAVIVPVGSKGGFVVKNPPSEGGREAVTAEGIACYKIFIRGLLDLTDNLDSKGQVLPPPRVVRHDPDDPYLVVAADKGTATFSDIANGVSVEYGFWLGDAFASGGSVGYDHKKMAITARGAWESVKRHFREMGVDTQNEDFTVIGVGDMSGDVFGNGMLLSPHIRLIAAFNHMHIFIDPNPNPQTSLAERRRLFDMPRSMWSDYSAKRISKGGGVFERRAKWVPLSKEMKDLFDVTVDKMAPNDLIKLILKLEADLLWFGGIGTYLKASSESHADVGDRTNDAVRVNAREVRAKVIAEGANLGVTQRARIEYALAGGRLNTDSIDNSAGVDCSDHEVNIKILLDVMVAQKKLGQRARNALLERMTDEVGALVLWDNYEQTQAISTIQARGTDLVDHQIRLMRMLEKSDRLDRDVEFLPDDETLSERAVGGQGLTRPEVSVLMSYSKIWLFDELLASDLPDDPFLVRDLLRYFPTPLQKKYQADIGQHRLRREIVATRVTNSMINRVGGTFVTQLMEKTGMAPGDIARAFILAREVFSVRDMWHPIEALDNRVHARTQTAMLLDINKLLERATMWFLRNGVAGQSLEASVERFQAGNNELYAGLHDVLPAHYLADLDRRAEAYISDGVPKDLALRIAGLVNMASGIDIVLLAEQRGLKVCDVAALYFAVGSKFRLGRMRAACEALTSDSHWQKLAISALVEELFGHQYNLAAHVLDVSRNVTDPLKALALWADTYQDAINRTEQLLTELWAGDINDISMIAVASRAFKSLVDERAS